MFVESRGQALQIGLYTPGPEALTGYLLDVIHRERTQLQTEKRRNQELTKELESKTLELDKLHEKYLWQEKELELLKMLVKSPATTSSREADESASIQRDEDMPGPSHFFKHLDSSSNGSPSDMLRDPIFIKKDDERLPTVSSNSASASQTSQELLLGVAQYILCTLCPEEVQGIKEMEDHFLSQHVDKEKQHCEACPTEQPTDIIQHIRMHTNRIYACIFCGKRGRKNYLKSHIRKHTGERPFNCDTCGRDFADSSTLRRHRLVHSGEKKHICPICGRGIARKDNVKSHLKSHRVSELQSFSKCNPNESDTN
ncbi:hypothetical protein WR25_11927 [Diploscapter pachys]|uniref:C2H2-type domain-containing protein n=1 Tax=Diploscapter pachys TaxID=2018661 RepID=A0A2A2LTN6_9BILA|nr:hypothetical protein WR25_11927 [Diploscapter pachys]